MNDHPFVSVIIASYNRPDLLAACIRSVLDNSYQNFEILVVWQGRDERTKNAVEGFFPSSDKVKTVHCEKLGVTHARNLGVSESRGEILAFIDDDAVACKDWLYAYVEAFSQITPRPGIAGGKVKPLWEGGRPNWYPKEREFLLGLYDIGDLSCPFPKDDLPFLANLALPKEVFEQVEGIDGRLGFNASNKEIVSGADSLLALRIKDKGYSLYYVPQAMVRHKIPPSKVKKFFFLKRHYYEGKSFIRMQIFRTNIKQEQVPNVLRFHSKKMLKDLLYLPANIFLPDGTPPSRFMLCLSKMLVSLGICVECSKHLNLSGNI